MNYKHIGAVLASALLLAGCLMGPNYKPAGRPRACADSQRHAP